MAESVPHIWIVGSSIIRRLHADVCAQGLDINLGLRAKVTWEGRGGRRWEHLLPVLRSLLTQGPAPRVILVHLGGNSLCREGLTRLDFFREMKADLLEVFRLFPNTRILFSGILPRLNWRGQTGRTARGIERSRRWLNAAMSVFLAGRQMGCIRHKNIGLSHLCRDGVHLSSEGNRLLRRNIRDALRMELR